MIALVAIALALAAIGRGGAWVGLPALAGVATFLLGWRHPVVEAVGRRETVRGAIALAAGLAASFVLSLVAGPPPAPIAWAATAIAATAIAIHARRRRDRIRRRVFADYFGD